MTQAFHPYVRLAACLIVASVLAGGAASARKRDAALETGLRAIRLKAATPDFSYDAGGGAMRLSALTGRVVVLNFWATWCEPCRAELAALVRLRAVYGDATPLLTISAEAPGVARAFLKARQLALPLIEDPERKIFAAYSVEPIPVTLVLGRDGTVQHVSVGQIDWAELQEAVESATRQPQPQSQEPAPVPAPSRGRRPGTAK